MTEVIQVTKEFNGRLGQALGENGATRSAAGFGCKVALETGRLVGVLGKPSARSIPKATLEWGQPGW